MMKQESSVSIIKINAVVNTLSEYNENQKLSTATPL